MPAQIARMETYCQNKGFDVVEQFNLDESAYGTKRDEFDKAFVFIEGQKEKIAVCFDKVDRFSRNVFDPRIPKIMGLVKSGKIEIHFASDNQILNGDISSLQKTAFNFSLVMSEYYSNAISDNVKRAFEQKRRNGEWTGGVRLGYLNVPLDEGKRTRKGIIIDTERGHLVQKMFELYATGNYSLTTLRAKIEELGLKTIKGHVPTRSGIDNMLKDSFYCGTAVSKKYGPFVHNYPRLISRELFDKCQAVGKERHQTHTKMLSKDFIFKGLLKCQNCGCAITAERKIKNGKTFVYYSCTNGKGICKRVYINEKDLLKPVYEVLERFESITEDVQKDLVDELRKTTEAEKIFHKAQITRIQNEYKSLVVKQDRLLEMFLEDGTSITKEVYDKKRQEYADKQQLLEIELSEHRKADFEYQTVVSVVVTVARQAKEIFDKSSEVAEKRAFLNYLLQNPTVNGKKLYFSIASPFNLVLDLATSPNWLRG